MIKNYDEFLNESIQNDLKQNLEVAFDKVFNNASEYGFDDNALKNIAKGKNENDCINAFVGQVCNNLPSKKMWGQTTGKNYKEVESFIIDLVKEKMK